MTALDAFADEVGTVGPVTCAGAGTCSSVGGSVSAGTRSVRAPDGVVAFDPAEMTVRVGAGTPVAHLLELLRSAGQQVALPERPGGTVGGALAVGWSDVRRLGLGPVRDTLLEARYVSADGRAVKAGGPTVKNVTGFDLCRLLVGSLGTLGLLGEVVLRTRPAPETVAWHEGEADPFDLLATLYRPSAILWDGSTTWVRLEGYGDDVAAQARTLEVAGLAPAAAGPALPPHRRSVPPSKLASLEGEFVAEVGVGVVHHAEPSPVRVLDPVVQALNRRVKERFDPTGRLSPGRDPATR